MKNPYYVAYQKYAQKFKSDTKRQRSFGEQMFPVFFCTSILMLVIHLLSFGAAVAWPAHISSLMLGSFTSGLIAGSIALILAIEVPKYVCVHVFFENFFKNRSISWGMGLTALLLIGFSIVSSTFSVPLALEKLSPSVELISIDGIKQDYDLKKQNALAFWTPQVDNANAQVLTFKKENEKFYESENRTRLSRGRAIQRPYKKLKDIAEATTVKRDKELDEIAAERKQEISEAKAENELRKSEHKSDTHHAGLVGFWLMLGIEVAYLLIMCWNMYYKNRSENEHDTDKPSQPDTDSDQSDDESGAKVVKIGKKEDSGGGQSDSNSFEHNANPMKHGEPFFPPGSKVAWISYKKEDGKYTEYTASTLLRFSKRPKTSASQKTEYERLAQIALNYKRKAQ